MVFNIIVHVYVLRQGFNKTEFVSFHTRQIQSYGYVQLSWGVLEYSINCTFWGVHGVV